MVITGEKKKKLVLAGWMDEEYRKLALDEKRVIVKGKSMKLDRSLEWLQIMQRDLVKLDWK